MLLGFFGAAPSAYAQVRAGAGADTQDSKPPLNGTARDPDIAQTRVEYDPAAGTVQLTVRTWQTWAESKGGYSLFEAKIGSMVEVYSYGCSSGNTGDVNFTAGIDPNGGPGSFSVSGFDGTSPLTRTFSADKLEATFTAASPVLAGRDYRCANTLSLYTPDGDGHCAPSLNNCQTIAYRYTIDTADSFFFDGLTPKIPQCDDHVDNDGDGSTDYLFDRGCTDRSDDSESGEPQCNDGRDNDGDGRIDFEREVRAGGPDPSCASAADNDEGGDPQCDDRRDNDGDGDTDYPFDDDCSSATDSFEGPAVCGDGRDNDGDGRTDAKDPGCRGKTTAGSEVDPTAVATRFTLSAKRSRCGIDTEAEVLPDLTPAKLFPFEKVMFTVTQVRGGRYRVTRKVPVGESPLYRYAMLRPGTYRVKAFYAGDAWRKKSTVRMRTVAIPKRCRR